MARINRRLRSWALLALLLVLAGTALAAGPAYAAAPSVEPPVGGPGTKFKFEADGFGDRALVSFYLVAPDGSVIGDKYYGFEARRDGSARWEWAAPEQNLLPGEWRMVAGPLADTATQMVVIPFTIAGPAPEAQPVDRAEPSSGPLGTTFSFALFGYDPGERVNYWASSPDGRAMGDEDFFVFADGSGTAQWTWQAPAEEVGGTWLMVGRGIDSLTERVVRFELGGAATPPAPAPTISVEPAAGAPGASFSFSTRSFGPGERVSYWASSPDGRAMGDESFVIFPDDLSRLEWTWQAPVDAVPGTWLMVAFGDTSRRTETVRFEIR